MEALVALGLASNTVQFLDFATKLCATAIEIHHGTSGTLASNVQAEGLVKDFVGSIDDVSSNLNRYFNALGTASQQANAKDDTGIASIISNCQDIAKDMLQHLDKLRSSGKSGKWKSFVSSAKYVWKKPELEDLQKRLRHNREQLEWHILLSLRESVNLLASRQEDQFQVLQSNMVTKFTEAIRDQISALPQWPGSGTWSQQQALSSSPDSAPSSCTQASSLTKSASSCLNEDADQVLDSLASRYATIYARKLANVEKELWKSLWFPVLDDREDEIAIAELYTFHWILQHPDAATCAWDDFIQWLEHGDSIYWINGKAGSGKSTLMKYISHHPTVKSSLRTWSGGTTLIVAKFFFWYGGNALQKSQEGLLRSILFQILANHRELVPIVLSDTVSDSTPFTWTLPLLTRAFKRLVEQSKVPLKLCFFIDGLDEYVGDHTKIVKLLDYAATFKHVKICVSSRPLLVFDRSYKDTPSLKLQDLTFDDIATYIQRKFCEDERFKELAAEESGLGASLALQIVKKASGVFLWVKLVVDSLLEGIQNYDRGTDLKRRLDELPDDLNELYRLMLDRIKPSWYLEEGFKLLLMVHAAIEPLTLLQVALIDAEQHSLYHDISSISSDTQTTLCKNMVGRIKSRCAGLLEVTGSSGKPQRVQFLHKSVKDFLETPEVMERVQKCLSGKEFFVPEYTIVTGHLLELMTLEARLCKRINLIHDALPRQVWLDEIKPIAISAARYGNRADSKISGCGSATGPLLKACNDIVNVYWHQVCFKSSEEHGYWSFDTPRQPPGSRAVATSPTLPDSDAWGEPLTDEDYVAWKLPDEAEDDEPFDFPLALTGRT